MYFKKINKNDLQVNSEKDRDELNKIKVGEVVNVIIKQSRNYKHLCKLWTIAKIVVENSTGFKNKNQLMYATKKALGYVEDKILFTGEVEEAVKSIDYESMSKIKFKEFYTGAIILWSEFLGITVEELENESE